MGSQSSVSGKLCEDFLGHTARSRSDQVIGKEVVGMGTFLQRNLHLQHTPVSFKLLILSETASMSVLRPFGLVLRRLR
jgi:hypothetical protein